MIGSKFAGVITKERGDTKEWVAFENYLHREVYKVYQLSALCSHARRRGRLRREMLLATWLRGSRGC